jgi:ankyrin repeat protein
LDVTDSDGLTLLHTAIGSDSCNVDVLECLLDKGADVNATAHDGSFKGLSPLMAASNAGHTEVAQLLVARGANVDALDEAGRSALHYAAFPSNHAEMVAVLLELGVAPDGFREPAKSPLVTAVLRGHLQSAQLLINAGADNFAPCMSYGKGAAELAARLRQTTDEVAQLTLARALKAALLNDVQRPLLMVADTPAMEKMLLAAGADAHATDPNGNATLHAAAAAGYPAPVLCLLIKAGVDLHAVNMDA